MTLLIADDHRVRTLTLNRPEALNAFNEALYDATAEALNAAADDPKVAVVMITGTGRAFSAGIEPTIPALHCSMTSLGLLMMNSGAPTTGSDRCLKSSGRAMAISGT